MAKEKSTKKKERISKFLHAVEDEEIQEQVEYKDKPKTCEKCGQYLRPPFYGPYPTPVQLMIRSLADAISSLTQVTSERYTYTWAAPLVEELVEIVIPNARVARVIKRIKVRQKTL